MTENSLIIGSGFSFHNMRAFSFDGITAPDPANDAFKDWLIAVCTGPISENCCLPIDSLDFQVMIRSIV